MISSSQTAFERVEAFLARPGDTKAPTVGKIRPHELRGRSDDTVYTGVALPEQETESTPALEVEAGDGDPDYSSLAAHFFTDLTTAARKAPAASPAAGAAFFCSIGDLNGFFEVFTCGIFQCYLETVAAPAPERGPRWTPNTDVSYKCYTDECPDENGGYGLDVWAEEGGGMTYGIDGEYYDLYWEFCTWEDVECDSEEEDPGSGGAGGGGSGGPNPPVTCSDGYIDNGSGTCVTLTMELCEYWFVSFWGIDLKSSGCLKELTHNDSALVNAAIAMWKDTTTMDTTTAQADSTKKACAAGMQKLMSIYSATPSRLYRGGELGNARGTGMHDAITKHHLLGGTVIHIEAWIFDSAGVGVSSPNATQIEYRRMMAHILFHEGLHVQPGAVFHSIPPVDAYGRYVDEPFRRVQETLSHRSPCLQPPS